MRISTQRALWAAPVVLAAVILGACSAPSTPSQPGGGSGAADSLDQTKWALTSINGEAVPDGISATMAFDNGQVSGSAGCNHYGGSYKAEGSTVTFSETVSTLMACEESMMEVESAFMAVLQGSASFVMAGQTLTLTGADGSLLVFSAR